MAGTFPQRFHLKTLLIAVAVVAMVVQAARHLADWLAPKTDIIGIVEGSERLPAADRTIWTRLPETSTPVSVTTDAHGRYRFYRLPRHHAYTLWLDERDAAAAAVQVQATERTVQAAPLQLSPGTQVTLELVDLRTGEAPSRFRADVRAFGGPGNPEFEHSSSRPLTGGAATFCLAAGSNIVLIDDGIVNYPLAGLVQTGWPTDHEPGQQYLQRYAFHERPGGPPDLAPLLTAGNGHTYTVIPFEGSWDEARATAKLFHYAGLRGHLLTVTSSSEAKFIARTFPRLASWTAGAVRPPSEEGQWEAGPEQGATLMDVPGSIPTKPHGTAGNGMEQAPLFLRWEGSQNAADRAWVWRSDADSGSALIVEFSP